MRKEEQPIVEPVAWRHSIIEPGEVETSLLLSVSSENPWSHWLKAHRDRCEYHCEPLYSASTIEALQAEIERLKGERDEPELTCPHIDILLERADVPAEVRSELAAIRDINSQLRYGLWHEKQRATTAESEASALRKRVEELESALRPFAEHAAELSDHWTDDSPGFYFSKNGWDQPSSVTVGAFRRARTLTEGGNNAG